MIESTVYSLAPPVDTHPQKDLTIKQLNKLLDRSRGGLHAGFGVGLVRWMVGYIGFWVVVCTVALVLS